MAAILSVLPRPRGRQPADDPIRLLNIFPARYNGRVFIYAIAFEGDVVKVGQTVSPRSRLSNHWRRGNGEVKWVHLFASMHPDTAKMVEARAARALEGIAEPINKSEWCFSSATRDEVVGAIRPLIDECKREINEKWDREAEAKRKFAAARELLAKHGLQDVLGRA